jgi:hypothetical protein
MLRLKFKVFIYSLTTYGFSKYYKECAFVFSRHQIYIG